MVDFFWKVSLWFFAKWVLGTFQELGLGNIPLRRMHQLFGAMDLMWLYFIKSCLVWLPSSHKNSCEDESSCQKPRKERQAYWNWFDNGCLLISFIDPWRHLHFRIVEWSSHGFDHNMSQCLALWLWIFPIQGFALHLYGSHCGWVHYRRGFCQANAMEHQKPIPPSLIEVYHWVCPMLWRIILVLLVAEKMTRWLVRLHKMTRTWPCKNTGYLELMLWSNTRTAMRGSDAFMLVRMPAPQLCWGTPCFKIVEALKNVEDLIFTKIFNWPWGTSPTPLRLRLARLARLVWEPGMGRWGRGILDRWRLGWCITRQSDHLEIPRTIFADRCFFLYNIKHQQTCSGFGRILISMLVIWRFPYMGNPQNG